ncbi:MAG: aminotransferase [Acidimicrobiia bacterium]|nr:aminotransferase [Acidimicrobiia bacterium]
MDRSPPNLNRRVRATVTSPVSEVRAWVADGGYDHGYPLLDVSQAVPGYPPPTLLTEHLSRLDPVAVSKYGPVLGDPELRSALASDLSATYRGTVGPDQVAVTAGANQAFCLAVAVLCEPGDRVILPVPHYFNHDMWLSISGVKPDYLTCGDGMLPSVETAESLIDDRTRAIVLVTPNNPTGAVYPPELISDFARLAAERRLYLILDETYRDFRTTTEPAHRLFKDPGWDRTVIHIQSFSKVYSIPGFRVGAMAASAGMLHQVDKAADCLTICPNRIGQEAARYGLAHLGPWVESNRNMLNRRVESFVAAMEGSPYSVASAGGYFAYVRHPFEGMGSKEVARRLFYGLGIVSLAGEMFGPGQDRYLRLAFANLEDDQVTELARRLITGAEAW